MSGTETGIVVCGVVMFGLELIDAETVVDVVVDLEIKALFEL